MAENRTLIPEDAAITEHLAAFARHAYLDNPLPSLFKERLFVYLSRFCSVKYSIIRHAGYLAGLGHPSGDRRSPPDTMDRVVRLIKRPLAAWTDIETQVARFPRVPWTTSDLASLDEDAEGAVISCATHVFSQTLHAQRCHEALQRWLGPGHMELLLMLLAFIRTVHYSTKIQPGLKEDEDMLLLLDKHAALAEAVYNDPESMVWDINAGLLDELSLVRQQRAAQDTELRTYQVAYHNHADELIRVRASLAESESFLQESESWLQGWKEAFQASLKGSPLNVSLEALINTVIGHWKGEARAAFYIMSGNKDRLYLAAGMTDEYAADVNGFKVGPESLACGLAAHINGAVITPDVEEDPLWGPWLGIARKHHYRACWSFPVSTEGGPVLGAMSIYFEDRRSPTLRELELARVMTYAAAIIISREQQLLERTKVEKTLRENESQLRVLLRLREEFIGNASHELKTPLTSMLVYTEMLETDFRNQGSPRHAEMMKKLSVQVDKLNVLVTTMLDTTRMAEGKAVLSYSSYSLNDLIREKVEEMQRVSPHHTMVIRLTEMTNVESDQQRIGQVLMNLLSNAIKYSPKGGQVLITSEVQDGEVRVSISDQGLGIPADALEDIFERFYRVDSKEVRTFPGMGIGLSICKGIIEMHGGKIVVESTLGLGSTFTFSIPARQRHDVV